MKSDLTGHDQKFGMESPWRILHTQVARSDHGFAFNTQSLGFIDKWSCQKENTMNDSSGF